MPSRARVSPDGRLGAVTAFVTGHSYADPGSFSTRATIIDMERGRRIADLEDFEVSRDGKPFESIDFNFWGVTFARGRQHLLRHARERRGDVSRARGISAERTMVTMRRERRVPVALT